MLISKNRLRSLFIIWQIVLVINCIQKTLTIDAEWRTVKIFGHLKLLALHGRGHTIIKNYGDKNWVYNGLKTNNPDSLCSYSKKMYDLPQLLTTIVSENKYFYLNFSIRLKRNNFNILSPPKKITKIKSVADKKFLVDRYDYSNLETEKNQIKNDAVPMVRGKKVYITSPIFYLNGDPHIGHFYTLIICDLLRIFFKLNGYGTFFTSGTDEHGKKIIISAAGYGYGCSEESSDNSRNNCKYTDTKLSLGSIEEFVRNQRNKFMNFHKLCGVNVDKFVRTSNDHHKRYVQKIWKKLEDNGDIYKGYYSGWYSINDEVFCEDHEVDHEGMHKISGEKLNRIVKEETYFFKLSKYAARIKSLYHENDEIIHPKSFRDEVKKLLLQSSYLEDISISRPNLEWGTCVPGSRNHTVYVWFDALLSYISAICDQSGIEDIGDFSNIWPPSIQVIGKDILRFHAILYPGLLFALNLHLPEKILVHGWIKSNNKKISKTSNNSIDLSEILVNELDKDLLRFFLINSVSTGSDMDFSSDKYNNAKCLVKNVIANAFHRVTTIIYRNFDGFLYKPLNYTLDDLYLLEKSFELSKTVNKMINRMELQKYSVEILEFFRRINRYINSQEPWKLIGSDRNRLGAIMYVLSEVFRRVAILSMPLLPDLSSLLLDQLKVSDMERSFKFISRKIGITTSKIMQPTPLLK